MLGPVGKNLATSEPTVVTLTVTICAMLTFATALGKETEIVPGSSGKSSALHSFQTFPGN